MDADLADRDGVWGAAEIDPMSEHESRHVTHSPVKRLGMAIIEQTVNDLRVSLNTKGSFRPKGEPKGVDRKVFRAQVERDIAGDWFEFWCTAVGLDVSYMRKQLDRIRQGELLLSGVKVLHRVRSDKNDTVDLGYVPRVPRRGYVRRICAMLVLCFIGRTEMVTPPTLSAQITQKLPAHLRWYHDFDFTI